MEPATKEFLRSLNALFVKLEEPGHLQHVVQTFLVREGVKPGFTLDVEWIGTRADLKSQFVEPLQELLGPKVEIILEYWRRPKKNYHHMSLWILTKQVMKEADLTLTRNRRFPDPDSLNVLKPLSIPVDKWWKLLGYPTDASLTVPMAVVRYDVSLTPDFKGVVSHCDDQDHSEVYRYGVQCEFFNNHKEKVVQQAEGICAALAKLGKSNYAVDILH